MTARLRMFAGPNGSGKSTLKSVLPAYHLGTFVNADEIEKKIRENAALDLADYSVTVEEIEVRSFFAASTLLNSAGLGDVAAHLRLDGTRLVFGGIAINSYIASATADLIRRRLLATRTSFSFETVMSSRDKVDFLGEVRGEGYRTYLYYVATDDPEINISRVKYRVSQGGHDVPVDKIVSRYHRSLALLRAAIKRTDRAFIFDSSAPDREHQLVAEVTAGEEIRLMVDDVPNWFARAVLDFAKPA